MITKITLQFARALSWDNAEAGYDPKIKDAAPKIFEMGHYLIKIGSLVSNIQCDLHDGVESDVLELFRIHTPGLIPKVTHRTKKYRVYSIPMLYIHEEDPVS